jgi:hypothetical protein
MLSPRAAGNSADGKVAVTTSYDGRRLVSSPTSLEACRIEGVLPELLLLRDLQRGKLDPADDPYASCACANAEQLQMKNDFIERKRRALVSNVCQARERLLLAGKKQPPPPAARLPNIGGAPGTATGTRQGRQASPGGRSAASSPRATAGDGREGDGNASASRRADRVGTAKSASSSSATALGGTVHSVPLPPDLTDAAQLFETLRSQAAQNAAREARWQEKMDKIEEKVRTASVRRAEKAATRAATHDKRAVTAQRRAQELDQERQRKALELVEREDEKLRTISAQRTQRHQEMRTAHPDRGQKEREEMERREEQRVEALREKLDKAQAASSEAQERQARDRERRAFLSDLQGAAYREQTARTSRAKEHRSLELEQRLLEAQARRDEQQQERDQHQFQKSLLREVVARQKQEVVAFMQSTGGRVSPSAPPPQWLEPQLQTLKEKQKASTARGPRPPSSPRSDANGRTPRAPASRTTKVREPFTIHSAATPRKQAFAPWMYQTE